jgi:hypothetical protein
VSAARLASLGNALRPESCDGPNTMPSQSAAPVTSAVQSDVSLRLLETGLSSNQAFAISRGSRDASARHLGLIVAFLAGDGPPHLSDPGKAIGPGNLPSSPSRLRGVRQGASRRTAGRSSSAARCAVRCPAPSSQPAGTPDTGTRTLGEIDPQIQPSALSVELNTDHLPRLLEAERGLNKSPSCMPSSNPPETRCPARSQPDRTNPTQISEEPVFTSRRSERFILI